MVEMRRFILVFLLVTVGCDGTLVGPEDERSQPPCMTEVSLSPTSVTLSPGGIVVFEATGGTGDHRFSISDDQSGGRINDRTGTYLAGVTPGVDVIEVSDRGCVSAANATVTVTEGLVLTPARVEVAPAGRVPFEASGGSGDYVFQLTRNESGGNVDGSGVYVAGGAEGQDVVRVHDNATGAEAEGIIDVDTGAALVPVHARIHLPLGGTYEIQVTGGSGYLDAASSGVVTVADNVATGESVGRTDVRLTDRFTGQTASITVDVVGPLSAPAVPFGERGRATIRTGDYDGDGTTDAVVAVSGSNAGRHRGGAVAVYRGEGSGVSTEPVFVLTGSYRDDRFGRSIEVADLDGDGNPELLIGAHQSDATATNVGAVHVYRGLADDFFETSPAQTFVGTNSYDRFGSAISVCDFNGDGFVDIAIGAPDAEDRERAPRADQQGSVQLFVSYDGVFLTIPDQVIFGEIPAAGGWTAHTNMRLGESMASGDFDGDGLCDLGVQVRRPDADVSDDGGFVLLRGRGPEAPSRGGLEARPSFGAVAMSDSEDRTSNLGARMAMGDLDGDGMAEVVLSQHAHDLGATGDVGAIRIFRGRTLSGEASSLASETDADMTLEGHDGERYFGDTVLVTDFDGDGRADLVAGDARGEDLDPPERRMGMVRVYAGRDGSLPNATPTRSFRGPVGEGRFGQGVGVLGGDRVLVWAAYVDDIGALYVATSPDTTTSVPFPNDSTGRRLGFAVAAIGDVNGDGRGDVAVSAPYEPLAGSGADYGEVHVYYGQAGGGVSSDPSATLSGFRGHSTSDRNGYDLAGAGDFDGDGYGDLAVLARYDDRPATFDPLEYVGFAGCEGTASNPGAIWIFRGGPSGLSAEPAFVYYGPYTTRNMERVAGGFDFEGDGYDDLLVGSTNWNGPGERTGGFGVVGGLDADPTGLTVVICDPTFVIDGDAASDDLGADLTPLGDLDGDGCDEVAAGAARVESSAATEDRDEGAVYVVFGYGGVTCPATTPEVLRLDGNSRDARAGQSVAGGVDVDGDGVPDLVVGAGSYRDGRGEVGRAYFVSGEYIVRSRGATGFVPMLDSLSTAALTIEGSAAGERLGRSVALVEGVGIAAGAPFGDSAGVANTGGAVVYRFGATGFERTPLTTLVGETFQVDGELGAQMAGGRVGGAPTLVVGAPWSGATALEQGAAYVLDLSP